MMPKTIKLIAKHVIKIQFRYSLDFIETSWLNNGRLPQGYPARSLRCNALAHRNILNVNKTNDYF